MNAFLNEAFMRNKILKFLKGNNIWKFHKFISRKVNVSFKNSEKLIEVKTLTPF
jgi:hypothetical protein